MSNRSARIAAATWRAPAAGVAVREQRVLEGVQRLRPGAALIGLEVAVAARGQPEQRERRCDVERQRVLDQALDRRESGVAGGEDQRPGAVGQHEVADRPPQIDRVASLDRPGEQQLCKRGVGRHGRRRSAGCGRRRDSLPRDTRPRTSSPAVSIVPARPSVDRLAGQEAQTVAARRLQVQQAGVGRQFAHRAHRGHDLLRRNVGGPAGFQRLQRDLAAGRGVGAHQRVALLLLGLGQRVVEGHRLGDFA